MASGERAHLLSASAASVPLTAPDSDEEKARKSGGRKSQQRGGREKNVNGFNLLFLMRFYRITRVVFPTLCCKTLLLLALLVFSQTAEEYNVYLTGLIPSEFFFALGNKSVAQFKSTLWMAAVTVFSVTICKSAGLFVAGLLYVRGRGLITRHLHRHYFRGINYYRLNITDRTIDNPDQRITQDVDKFCDELTEVLPKIILSPVIIAYYTYMTYQSVGYLGPLCIYGYFVVSSVVNKFLMSSIASTVVRQERLEGDFRYHHTQIRSNAESIAFYRGGKIEAEKSNKLLQVLLRTQLSVVHWQFPLNMSMGVFDYAGAIISYCLVGVAIFSGKYNSLDLSALSAVISKNAFISMYLLNNFSTVVDTAVKFGDIAGYTHRIGQLLEDLDSHGSSNERVERRDRGSRQGSRYQTQPHPHTSINSQCSVSVAPQCVDVAVVFEDLSVAPPHQSSPLFEGLNMKLCKGKNILVLGDTGSGKSSMLRVLRGLWRPLRGRATLCCEDSLHCIMFLPQKPYLTSGSLVDQITFPEKPKRDDWVSSYQSTIGDNRIQEAVSLAGLAHLAERLGGVNVDIAGNWYDIVSPGEMQKIGFARLFFHQPQFAVLDEATSSLSEGSEFYFYTTLSQLSITVLSIGHRSTLQKFHSQRLLLDSSGSWTLQDVQIS